MTDEDVYQRWQKSVRELRDSVVHRGSPINEKQARDARKAVFDIMTKIDPTVMDNFRIQLEKIQQDRPSMTFGQFKG